MSTTAARWFAVVFALAGSVASLDAKGATAKVTISGGPLVRAIDVIEDRLLAGSNVYEGAFIGPTIAPPDPRLARYTVSFYVQAPAWMKEPVRVRYVVYYVTDTRTGDGFLYLPARGEPGYAVNVGTIERTGDDGHWHEAPKAWASALNRYIR